MHELKKLNIRRFLNSYSLKWCEALAFEKIICGKFYTKVNFKYFWIFHASIFSKYLNFIESFSKIFFQVFLSKCLFCLIKNSRVVKNWRNRRQFLIYFCLENSIFDWMELIIELKFRPKFRIKFTLLLFHLIMESTKWDTKSPEFIQHLILR